MARDLYTNQGSTTVSAGGTGAPAAGSTESWTVASSATFPAASNVANPATQFYVSDPALPSETILVTNVSGATWSVTRGADGTTPVAHTAGFTVRNVVSAAWLQAIDDRVKFNTLNVRDYGAKGNNAANDQPAIQAALDDAWRMGGATVIVPPGIYRIYSAAVSSSPLKIRSNIRLQLLAGAEIHRYANPSAASLVWSGDWAQGAAGFNGQRNMIVEGGVWDMRNSSSTVTLAADTFTKANSTAPHALGALTTGGMTWIEETSRDDGISGSADTTVGNLGISSNAAYNPVAGTNISTIKAWPDGTTQVTVSTTNTTGQTGLVFRLVDVLNYWQLTRDGTTGNARLSYWTNGVETVVSPNTSRSVAAGAVLTVTCIGTRVITGVITGGTYAMSHDTTDATGRYNARKSGVVITDTTSRLTSFSSSASIWSDNFNRTSAASLGTTSSGYAWTAQSGTLGTTGGASAYAPGAGTNISTVDVTSETNPSVVFTTVGTGAAGVVFRYIDNSNYWYYGRNGGTGNAELIKTVAGTPTTITPGATQAIANSNTISVSVMGYEITCSVGATVTHTVNNDSANYAGTKAGIRIDDTTSRLDTFDTPAAWGVSSGACFSWSHTTNTVWRDMTILDTHQNSHGIDLQGCQDVVIDNVRLLGCVGNQQRGAVQIDAAYNDGTPPKDSTNSKNVLIRGCQVAKSDSPGTNAYPRGFESHASRVTTWYSGMRIVDNYFDVTERAVRGYNWNNSIISNNEIVNGWGIEYRPIWTGITPPDIDTMDRTGLQTSATQAVNGVTIAGNTLSVAGSSAGSADFAIRVFGETTGHIQEVAITGNTINGSASGGIWAEYIDRGTISGNSIYNTADRGIWVKTSTDVTLANNTVNSAGNHGIALTSCTTCTATGNIFDTSTGAGAFHGFVLDTCTDLLFADNQSYLAGKHGVYFLAGSRLRCLNNYIYGASRNANAINASIKADSTGNDLTVSGNTTRAVGSGNDALWAFQCTTTTSTRLLSNDWHTGTSGDVSITATSNTSNSITNYLTADATASTSTTYALVAGLTAPVNATGTYRFKAVIFYSQATAANTVRFGIGGTTANASTGAPTKTAFGYLCTYVTTAAGATTVTGANDYLSNTTNSGTLGATATVYPCIIEGHIVATGSGTMQVQQLTGNTSDAVTVKNGSYFQIEKVVN